MYRQYSLRLEAAPAPTEYCKSLATYGDDIHILSVCSNLALNSEVRGAMVALKNRKRALFRLI